MQFVPTIPISVIDLPIFLPIRQALRSGHASLARRMPHGDQHGDPPRLDGGRHADRHRSRQSRWPGCSYGAAGARSINIPARAKALKLRDDTNGLRALGLQPVSLLRFALASLPVPRSHRAPAGQGQKQNPRAGRRRKLACERSAKTFPKTPSSAPAPDHRPIHSLRSFMTRPVVGRAARLEAPPRSRRGALLRLSLAGARSCFSPALGGLRELSLGKRESSLPHSLEAGKRFETANAQVKPPVRWEPLTTRRLALLRLLGQPARHLSAGERGKLPCPTPRGLRALARILAGFVSLWPIKCNSSSSQTLFKLQSSPVQMPFKPVAPDNQSLIKGAI